MTSKGVRPSAQRIAILQFLMEHPVHPTAEEIHSHLAPGMPTLSLTTVYNTLKLMAANDIVDVLHMDHRNAHFDYRTLPHAHMWCRKCGKIFDTKLHGDIQTMTHISHPLFMVEDVDIYYKGVCGECTKKDMTN